MWVVYKANHSDLCLFLTQFNLLSCLFIQWIQCLHWALRLYEGSIQYIHTQLSCKGIQHVIYLKNITFSNDICKQNQA